MPRYAPLPASSIDLRSEAELVQEAAQKILEASNGALNDFSAGNPLSALLEGQAFAAGEFLFWADRLPDKILEEWIGPFLGAMRRLGTPAVAQLRIEIPPSTETLFIPAGTEFRSEASRSGGESHTFVSTKDQLISPGDIVAFLSVSSKYVGSKYNIPANSITKLGSSFSGSSGILITNPQPASGGSDVETLDEVKRRFLSLIRRRNPSSKFDWQEFFIDMFGLGTITIVKPNRSQRSGYSQTKDFVSPQSNSIAFFVLGPDGQELTGEQIERAQRILNFSVPVNVSPFLYALSLDEVRIEIEMELSPTGFFTKDFLESSLNFRNTLMAIMMPGVLFPVDSPPSVGDLESAFNSAVPEDLRYRDPKILSTIAYNTPSGLTQDKALFSKVSKFSETGHLLLQGDLIKVETPTVKYYPVLANFNPRSSEKVDQASSGNLVLKKIRRLETGEFVRGEVVYYPADEGSGLRVILEPITVDSIYRIERLITEGKISSLKTGKFWGSGESLKSEEGGIYNPDLIYYDYKENEFIPGENSGLPVAVRPGGFVWLVNKEFIVPPSTNSLTGAKAEFLVGASVNPRRLESGVTYSSGEWVYTPLVGSGNEEADPYFFYVDSTKGVVSKYAFVEDEFTFEGNGEEVKKRFDYYVSNGNLTEVAVRNGENGLPVNYYSPRFNTGDYLEYKDSSNSVSSYFIAAIPFTPRSGKIEDLLADGVVLEVARETEDRQSFLKLIDEKIIPPPRRLFSFFRGDQTLFRNGSELKVFTAKKNVTPLFDFPVYLENKVFEEVSSSSESGASYIPFFRRGQEDFEDILVDDKGKNLYRVVRAFTPSPGNDLTKEEQLGNVLRIVTKFDCSDRLMNSLGDISSMKLGQALLTLKSDSRKESFLWGSTDSRDQEPDLIWRGASVPATLDYGEGTLAL